MDRKTGVPSGQGQGGPLDCDHAGGALFSRPDERMALVGNPGFAGDREPNFEVTFLGTGLPTFCQEKSGSLLQRSHQLANKDQ